MHFRFGHDAGRRLLLDDIRVTELDTGREVIPRCDFEAGAEVVLGMLDVLADRSAEHGGRGPGRAGLRARRLGRPARAAEARRPTATGPTSTSTISPDLALRRGQRYRVELWVRAEPARSLTVAFYRPGQTFTLPGRPAQLLHVADQAGGRRGRRFRQLPARAAVAAARASRSTGPRSMPRARRCWTPTRRRCCCRVSAWTRRPGGARRIPTT